MKQLPTIALRQPVMIRSLGITANIRLHPEFSTKPREFARKHGVTLAADIFPETDFRKHPADRYSGERIEKTKMNIHLVRHGAIRLFAERGEDGDQIRRIDLNPSMLLYKVERHLLFAGDLLRSLDILQSTVSPLLANPLDARHIVPGRVQDPECVAWWSSVDSEIFLPRIKIPCLHDLSHPSTGPAEGVTKKRVQFGDEGDECVIRFEEAKWKSAGANGTTTVEGVRVRLILKGCMLLRAFRPFGTTAKIDGRWRLVAFPEVSVGLVHQSMMARMEGTYLPVPAEWRNRRKGDKALTHAKSMALVSQLTSIPLEEIRAMDEGIRHPSESTRERLDDDLPVEVRRLAPVPVATLFHPSAYTFPNPGTAHPADGIDPLIAEAYGEPDALSD